MKAIITWLIEFKDWLIWIVWEAKDVWKTVLVLVLVVVVACFVFERGEQGIRVAGLVLELFGIGIVAKGLNDSRQLFGRPGIRTALLNIWERRPKLLKDEHVPIIGTVNVVNRR